METSSSRELTGLKLSIEDSKIVQDSKESKMYVFTGGEGGGGYFQFNKPVRRTCGLLTMLLSLRCDTDSSSVK